MNWLQKISDLNGILLYHGTDLQSAKSIAKEGIRSFSGDQWSNNPSIINYDIDAIYLTPNKELALRYALGIEKNRVPVILECYISGRHMRKLRTDPMDTWEGAWDEDGVSDSLPEHQESLYDLSRIIDQVIGYGWYRYQLPDNFDDYDGFNIYRFVLGIIKSQYSTEIAKRYLAKFREKLPPGDYDYYHVLPDGTIRLDASYWDAAHQIQFSPAKKSKLPPAAIKGVFVPVSILQGKKVEILETDRIRPVNLPSEDKDAYDTMQRTQEACVDFTEQLEGAENEKYIADIIGELSTWGDDECVIQLLDIANRMMENMDVGDEELQNYKDEWQEFDYDSWGQTASGDPVDMARVSLQQLLQI